MLILMPFLLILIWIASELFLLICDMRYRMKINNLLESIDSIEDLIYMGFKDLLNLVAEVFKRQGYAVKITDKCGDEGYGLILDEIKFVEIWNHALALADVEVAMKLAKRMQVNSIHRGVLITMGDIKYNTRLFCHKYVIESITGEQLLLMCKDIQKRRNVIQPVKSLD